MQAGPAQLTQYGQIAARLSRPLADRDAVLWLVRLDAAGFEALEAVCLTAIASDPSAATTFAQAYAQTLALLLDREASSSAAQPAPPTKQEGRGGKNDLAAQMETIAIAADPTEPEDMYTLASKTHVASPRGTKE